MRIPENRLSLSLIASLIFCVASPLALAQGARIRQAPVAAADGQGQQIEAPPASANGANNDAQTQAERRESDGDHPAEREDWFRSGRRALGEHAADLLHRAYVQKQSIRASQKIQRSAANSSVNTANSGQNTANGFPPPLPPNYLGNWTNLGPAPIASDPQQDYGAVVGRVTSVAVDQGDTTGNTVYIGAAFGGVWKSTNAADPTATSVNWTSLTDDQPTLAVGAITIQPGTTGNSAVVLIGTGEPNSSGDSYYGMGILRSTDGGQTWAPIIRTADNGAKTFSGLGASSFAWSTATPGLVVVAMGSTNGKHEGSDSIGGRGIYYSQDAGQNWHYAMVTDPGGAVLSEGSVTAVVFNPGTQKFYAAYRFHGFYESSDGINWTRSANQPDATGTLTVANCPTDQFGQLAGNCPLYRGQFAIQPVTNTMYVVYVDINDLDRGVYAASVSNGALSNWQQFRSGPCKDPASKATCGFSQTNPGIEDLDGGTPGSLIQGDYNLWIGAVPNGPDTDLFVGTRNIYKCSVGATNNCSTAGAWKDLTFVYGVGCPSTVPIAAASHLHPDQHGFDFSLTTTKVMYFVNDGGVYRSLNGTSTSDGTCTSPNPFENLDANMGSLSEMVSFSQHPSNPNVLLAGLQDNGSPALTLQNGTPVQQPETWLTSNGGDGGYNEIDPVTPAPNGGAAGDGIWYASNTFVSIQQCDSTNAMSKITAAEQCTPDLFGLPPFPAIGPNIGAPQVAHDRSEFYMPYILDPADTVNGPSRDIILGTCRIWRGPGAGGGTWDDATSNPNKMISPAFDSTAAIPCDSLSTKVRAIAAGGTPQMITQLDGVDSKGNAVNLPHMVSSVIYVGLEGAGTSIASGSNLGQVWVNTHADSQFGSSATAWHEIDQNANIAATSNGGLGPYPIADIQMDPHDMMGNTAYVVVQGFGVSHVWKTTQAGVPGSWTDLTNNLPDAPADSIAIDPDDANILYLGTDVGAFISVDGGANWEILGTNTTPGSLLPNVPVTKIRVFGSNAGANKMVRVSTYGRGVWQFSLQNSQAPAATDLSPAPLNFGTHAVNSPSPTTAIATFANNSSSAITITSISVLPGTGFALATSSPPNPCPSSGSLAASSACQVQVSFTPTAAGQFTSTLTIMGNAGTFMQSIALNGAGTSLSISPSSLSFNTSVANTAAQPITITNNGLAPVSLTGIALSSAAYSQNSTCPAALPAGQSCTIPVSFSPTVAGNFNAALTFTDGSSTTVRSIPLSGSASDFGLAVAGNGPSATVTGGQPASYTLNLAGINNFNGTVTFACSGLPAGAACNNPSTVVSGPNAIPVTLTITTVPHSSAQPGGVSGMTIPFANGGGSGSAVLAMLLLAGCAALTVKKRRRATTPTFALLMLAGALAFSPGCGGGGGGSSNNNPPPPPPSAPPPTTPQSSTVTVTATSGSRTQSVKLTLNVN